MNLFSTKKNKGFVILFAVTLSAILLSIALGVANIALKEVKFGTSAKDANNAFFATDTGIECALLNDKYIESSLFVSGNSPVALNCSGVQVNAIENPAGSSFWELVVPNLGSDAQSCARVTVDKSNSPLTTVISKGYSVAEQTCSPTNPDRIERELKVTYRGGGVPDAPPPPPPPPGPPLTPSGLIATTGSCGTGTINVSWNAATGATSYTLRDGAAVIYTGAGTSFPHSGLTAGSSHSYSVLATNAVGSSAYSSAVPGTAPVVCPPSDACGTDSGVTPKLNEPATGTTAACNPGTYVNSPADTTTSGLQAWNWSCGVVTSCTAPKYGCRTTTDTNFSLPQYGLNGPNNNYGCAGTCANGGTSYPTCTVSHFAYDTGKTLDNGLAAYWKLNEASGTRVSSFGSVNLTSNNGVPQALGKVSTSADFTTSSAQFLSSSSSVMQVGNSSFTFAGWFYLDSSTTTQMIFGKDSGVAGQREYRLRYNSANWHTDFQVYRPGDVPITVTDNVIGSISGSYWNFFAVWYDATPGNEKIYISINGNSPASQSTGGPLQTTTNGSLFTIGSRQFPGAESYLDGRVDELGFWKKALSWQEIQDLYHSNAGNTYNP